MFKSLLSVFRSSTGQYDMGRIISFKISTLFSGGFVWSIVHNHQVINWTEAGGGFSLVMAGCVALIAGKEMAVAKANSIAGATTNATNAANAAL